MISLRENNLYREVLIRPFHLGLANKLRVVSGYASPTMLGTHLADIQATDNPEPFSIEVVVGMSGSTSLSEKIVSAFLGQQVRTESLSSTILVPKGALNVHSKIYVWYRGDTPVLAWAGSANYSRLAFGLSEASDYRDEVLFPVDPIIGAAYVEKVLSNSAPLRDGIERATTVNQLELVAPNEVPVGDLPQKLDSKKFAICPLVNRKNGQIHNPGAGLNWGQPSGKRSRNDRLAAYLPVPSSQRHVFPKIGEPFEASFEDGQVLLLTRVQQGGKALTTPASNEALGLFFRAILGVQHQGAITTGDLNKFGSNCVVFEAVSLGNFVLHFYPGLMLNDLEQRLF